MKLHLFGGGNVRPPPFRQVSQESALTKSDPKHKLPEPHSYPCFPQNPFHDAAKHAGTCCRYAS